jgi:hypothetical protein
LPSPCEDPTFRDLTRAGDWIDYAPIQAGKALHLPILAGDDEVSFTDAPSPPPVRGCEQFIKALDRATDGAASRDGGAAALGSGERVVGTEHPDTLIPVNNLGECLRALENAAAALPLFAGDELANWFATCCAVLPWSQRSCPSPQHRTFEPQFAISPSKVSFSCASTHHSKMLRAIRKHALAKNRHSG